MLHESLKIQFIILQNIFETVKNFFFGYPWRIIDKTVRRVALHVTILNKIFLNIFSK